MDTEQIDFKDVAQRSADAQDGVARKWALLIAKSVKEAASQGFDCVYAHQITTIGFVENMKRYAVIDIMNHPEHSIFIGAIDDWDAMCAMTCIETFDSLPPQIRARAGEMAGCKIETSFTQDRIDWSKRVGAIRGDETLPF